MHQKATNCTKNFPDCCHQTKMHRTTNYS